MQLPEGSPYGHDGIFVFADCAAIPAPTASELAQIAVSANRTAKQLACIPEPKVAMLSFSTKGSAKHDNVTKVIEATRMAKELDPTIDIDGELQADAAIVPRWAQAKPRAATLQVKPTCLFSQTSKPETLPTSLFNASQELLLQVLSCKALPHQSTTCRADASLKTS